jgi:hypothetical protein
MKQSDIIELLLLALAIAGTLWKTWASNKKVSTLFSVRLTSMENSIGKLLESDSNKNFHKNVRNKIKRIANQIVSNETQLDEKYHTLLLNFSSAIEIFASEYFDSDMRKEPPLLRQYLEKEMSKILTNLDNHLIAINEEPKFYYAPNGKEALIYYNKLIKESGVYSCTYDKNTITDKLIQKLVDNGFTDNQELIDLFGKYILESFIIIRDKSIYFENKLIAVQ